MPATYDAAAAASLERRSRFLRDLEERGGDFRQARRQCAADVLFFVRWFCLTYDPRRTPAVLPFDLYPCQEELLRWLEERDRLQESGVVEKSRDMGVTWLCCAFALHRWLFRDGDKTGFGSRKLDLVDRLGDPDCIFEKIRFLLYNLPAWLAPTGFRRKEHDHHAKLVNPASGSTITGEGGDDIGRGGRCSRYFVDEAAHLERPQRVDAALSATTEVRIDVSTPAGPGNPFAVKRHSGAVPVFTLHWKQDPRKNRAETAPDGRTVYPWYEAARKRLADPVIVAQELDIDYSASIEGVCIPGAWVRAAVGLDLPASGPTVAGLDVAEEGPAQCVFQSRRGPLVDNPRAWNGDTTQTAHRAADAADELGAVLVCYDADGMGAGVRAAFRAMERPLRFRVRPVRGGGAATETRWPDGRMGRERFVNLRAELWWMLRTRFERTFAFVTRGEFFPAEDLISLPDHAQLIADLSLPRYFVRETGKVQLEAKKDMRRRGVKSPDFADALAYSFAPAAGGGHGYLGGGDPRPAQPPGGVPVPPRAARPAAEEARPEPGPRRRRQGYLGM